MEYLKTILFFLSLFTSVYFFTGFTRWAIWKINPKSFKKEITNKEILIINIGAYISLILWTIIYHIK